MEKTTKGLLIGSSVLAGITAAGAASVGATKYLVDVALNRDIPKYGERLAKNQIQRFSGSEKFLEELDFYGERLKNEPHEVVEITAHDGEKLVGHWFPCKDAKRVIVAMHGWRSQWYWDFGTIRKFWKENQCSVLYAEQRAQGSSGGKYMGFGMLERYDCRQWVRWVNSRNGEDLPVYLAGVSMGAATVLMTAGLELPENVTGIFADCGFTSPEAIWKHVAKKNLHIAYGHRKLMLERMCTDRIQMGTSAYSAPQALAGNKIPVMFAHGTDDHFVPVEMTYENYRACAAPKRLLIVPGADHGMCYYMEKERYEKMILEFWKDYEQPQASH